jgi:hypothetical protein
MTFRQAADRYIVAHEAAWRNEKHRWQWGQTLGIACREMAKRRSPPLPQAMS